MVTRLLRIEDIRRDLRVDSRAAEHFGRGECRDEKRVGIVDNHLWEWHPVCEEGKVVQMRRNNLMFRPMLLTVDTRDAVAVAAQVQSDYRLMFEGAGGSGAGVVNTRVLSAGVSGAGLPFVQQAFGWAVECFTGQLPDYLPIDARYHDFEHTLQGTLCLSSLLRGRFQAGERPVLGRRAYELGLLAILLHDTGYLKRRGDFDGTGAKYTLTHVARSCEFAAEFLARRGFDADEIKSVQNMIRCTGLDGDLASIQFQTEEERIVGYALGTADLLGQMAAPDYVDKLPVLYEEFVEAARFNGGNAPMVGGFASAEDLMKKTPVFWERYVRPKIEREFLGLYRFLANPVPSGPNNYLRCIEANIERLRGKPVMAN